MQVSLFFSYLASCCFFACKNCNAGAATTGMPVPKTFLSNIFLAVFNFLFAKIVIWELQLA